MILQLLGITFMRFLVWLALGLAVYFLHSRPHSRLETDAAEVA